MGIPADLIEDSTALWIAAADRIDAFDVALELTATAAGTAGDDEQFDLVRARLLLLTGRPSEALALLSRTQLTQLPAEPRASWPDLLLAACRAADGDHSAYRWLLSAVTALPGAWQPLYLVGAAAEQRGDYATADQAWTTLVQAHGIVTKFTLSRYLGAVVARRDLRDAAAATQTMLDVMQGFIAGDPDIYEHPQPILDAASYLRRRGDTVGSALLLHTASHRLPDVPALRTAIQQVTSGSAIRRFQRRKTSVRLAFVPLLAPAAALAVWCDLPPLVVAGLVPVLLLHRFTAKAVPGFTAVDSAAWRAGTRLRQGPASSPLNAEQHIVGALVVALLLTATVPISSAIAGIITGRADAIARTLWHAVLSGVAFTVITSALAAIGLALMALARSHNWRSERQRRHQADRYRLSDAGDCRCWNSDALTGSYATAYLKQHLNLAGPAALDTGRLPNGTAARCPTTGTLWLATAAPSNDELLLLRGADRRSTEQPLPATGGYL